MNFIFAIWSIEVNNNLYLGFLSDIILKASRGEEGKNPAIPFVVNSYKQCIRISALSLLFSLYLLN